MQQSDQTPWSLRRPLLAGLACLAALLAVGAGVASASNHGGEPAQGGAPSRSLTTVPNGGIPAVVNPAADLAAQRPGPQLTWIDSMFIAGFVHGGGHNFGILVHALKFPNARQLKLFIGVTDTTTGWFRNYQAIIPKGKYTWSRTRLHLVMPGLTWTGSARHMRVKATTPWGSVKVRLTRQGRVLNYSGIGLAKLLRDLDHEYAFPVMRTAGTLTAEGATRAVSGVSWLDRQWGPVPVTDRSMRWTWMDIALSDGDQLALWDIADHRAQHCWVTVLHPDGSYQLAPVRPLADGASRFWTSPVTHNVYPTRWRIDIPALHSRLRVAITGPRGQEYPDGHVEGTAAVTGAYEGAKVTGTTFVEMTGHWRRRS